MGLTQKDLAKGICSVSHLSKIENKSKDANIETISLLFEKLNIDKSEINEKEEQIKSQLMLLNEKMLFFQKNDVDLIFDKLVEIEDIIPFSTSLYTYELSKYRYFLFKGELKRAQQQENLLNKQKKNFSQQENYLFLHYNAICLILQGHYQKADTVLETLMTLNNNEFVSGELFYHRALVKSSLEHSDHAIYFGKKALQSFMNDHNFIRILHTLMLLGINYTYSRIYEEALECFQHLIRNAELLNEAHFLPHVFHNIGYLKTKMEKYHEALYFYEKSLSLQSEDTPYYLMTLYTIGESLYILQEIDKSQEVFERVLEQSKKLSSQKYILLSKYYLKSMSSYKESIEFLEMKVIPYLEESKEHPDTLNRFYRLLSTHYRQLARYEKAVKYIEKIS
ncbi:Transcriptional activator NprA [Pseudoneobacillus rhizosphaerae]|uniref:Transcriptional activator NprA n=2 Tax=Pseudoneobacillus rhizosphaerae TaxID=2880968 RepID=A0A9C7LA26_9BACI|nr:Transcriptional activator NprA [Pseudoneobacillus rhizosphaerae]